MITISELIHTDCQSWDAYVTTSANGLPQHLSGWREVLSRTNNYETCYLLARQNGQIVGVLPLFFVRSALTGHSASTMPGGLCADSDEVAAALVKRGRSIARQAGADRFALHDSRQAWPVDMQTSTHHVHWLVPLEPDSDTLWKRLPGNIRRQVRIARRNGLTVKIDRTGQHLAAFYDVFSRFTHQLGTPVFGRKFLEHVVDIFPDGFNIAVVFHQQQPIGGYFQLQLADTVYGVWGASLRETLSLRPAYLAHWEILRDSCDQGYRYLDMGRSPTASNASKYKAQWGGESHPIYQQVTGLGHNQNEESLAGWVKSDGKVKLLMQLWPKLPLPMAQFLGPMLRRHMPFA